MHFIKKVLFSFIIVTIVFGIKDVEIFAQSDVPVNHILTNEALLSGQQTPLSFMFSTVEVSRDSIVEANNHEDVPSYWLIPASEYGYIFYSRVIEYNDGVKVRSTDSILNLAEVENVENISEIHYYYSHASKITVNRYLKSNDEITLLQEDVFYGHEGADYTSYYDEEILINGQSILIDPNLNPYVFVEADSDISQAINFELSGSKQYNLFYEEKIVTPRNITIKCIDKNGKILEEKVISGALGEHVHIDDSFFSLRDNYKLTSKPSVGETIVNEEEQEFVFVYETEKIEEPILPEIIEPKEDDTVDSKVVDKDPIEKPTEDIKQTPEENSKKVVDKTVEQKVSTPKTGAANNSLFYMSVLFTALTALVIIKKY